MTKEQGEFWESLSDDPQPNAFDGFHVELEELFPLLPTDGQREVITALRLRAGQRERAAFEQTRDARLARKVIERHDRGWSCPVKRGARLFESEDGSLRVRFSASVPHQWAPAGVWVVESLRWREPRLEGDWPRWWPSRRAADDEARTIAARPGSQF